MTDVGMEDPYVYNITIPSAANWYESAIMTYTPDDMLIYGSKGDLIIIKDVANKSLRELVNVHIMRRVHSQRITSLSINAKWGEKGKLLVTTGEDKYVKLWDMEARDMRAAHQQHLTNNKIISAAFAGSDRIVSVSDEGAVILWNFVHNEIIHLTNIFNSKVTVTCLSVCPHYPKIAAFGMKSGLIVIADLRGKGNIVYKLRGHDKELISLDWCPIPFNIFPKNPRNKVYITPEQFATARNENTNQIVRQMLQEIVGSVCTNVERASVAETFHGSRTGAATESVVSSWESLAISSSVVAEESESLDACSKTLTVTADGKAVGYVTLSTPQAKNLPQQEIVSTLSETSTEIEIRQLDPSASTLSTVSEQEEGTRSIESGSSESQQVKETSNGKVVSDSVESKQEFAKGSDQKNVTVQTESQASVDVASGTNGGKWRRGKKKYHQVTPPTSLSPEPAADQVQEKTGTSTNGNTSTRAPFQPKEILKRPDQAKTGTSTNVDTSTRAQFQPKEILKRPDQAKTGTSTNVDTSAPAQFQPKKILKRPDQAKVSGRSKSDASTRRHSSSKDDLIRQAQARLKKSLNIDSPRSDSDPANEDNEVQGLNVPDAVAEWKERATKDKGSMPINKATGAITTEESQTEVVGQPEPPKTSAQPCSKGKKLDNSASRLQELILCPPCGSKAYCGACNTDEECNCTDAVKMVAPGIEIARNEFLLVSSAREPTVIVWRVGTGGTTQALLRLPLKKQKKARPSDKMWITVKWPVPNKIYCSSRSNELVQWTVPKPFRGEGESMKVIHSDHSALIFSIATSVEDFIHKSWTIPPEHVIWTTSQDRQLICYRIDGDENEIEKLASYPTFAGAPLCLAENKLNPYRIAIGTSGGVLKIWDMSHTTDKIVSMQHYTQKIHSKVTTAAWHIKDEHLIAFGTQEGRVGFINVDSKSGIPTLMPHFFTKEIYKIQWAPLKEDVYCLYIVAEGKLVYWDITTPDVEPVTVKTPEGQFVYTFAWKLDYSCLLISLKSGMLLTYSPELTEIDSLMCAQKLHLLAWNPLSYTNDPSIQTFCRMFAATLNGKTLIVMDNGKQTQNFDEKVVGKFEVHKDYINDITWNNYGTRVAVGTEDGFIFVWDLPTKAVVWSFLHETFQGVTSVIFSPVGTEHIFSGTRDCCLKVFKQKDYPALDAATLSIKRSLILGLKDEENKKVRDETLRRVGHDDKSQKGKQKKATELLPIFHRTRMSADEFLSDLRRLYTYVTEYRDLRDEATGSDGNYVDILDIFGCQDAMMEVVARNELLMRERGRGLDVTLAMFRDDSSSFLVEAVRQRRITPSIIGLAPFVSSRLWLEAVEIYADNLSEDPNSDPIEAATYYIACHRVREAIDLLCGRNMFKEALALAKCRCPEESAVVAGVIELWAQFALRNGDFERAAECFIYLGKFADAATALFKRTEPQILLFCVELADRIGDSKLHRAALYRYQKYADQGEHTKKLLKTDTIVDVLMNARMKAANTAGRSDGEAGPSTSYARRSNEVAGASSSYHGRSDGDVAQPSTSSAFMTDGDDTDPAPNFIAAAKAQLTDDDLDASPSASSLLSSASETFLTRGENDPSIHVIPAVENVEDLAGEAILQAIQSRVIQEAEEEIMGSDASSLRDYGASNSSTSVSSQHPEQR